MRTVTLLLCLAATPVFAVEGEATKTIDYGRLIRSDVADFSVDGLSRTDLMKLRFQLQEQRPGLVSPLALISGGAVIDILGLGLAVTAGLMGGVGNGPFGGRDFDPNLGHYTDPYFTAGGVISLVTGIVMVLGGAAMIVFGGMSLSDVLPARRAASFKMNLIDTELDKLGPVGPSQG